MDTIAILVGATFGVIGIAVGWLWYEGVQKIGEWIR